MTVMIKIRRYLPGVYGSAARQTFKKIDALDNDDVRQKVEALADEEVSKGADSVLIEVGAEARPFYRARRVKRFGPPTTA